MNRVLVRSRPELRLLGLSIAIATFSCFALVVSFRTVVTDPETIAEIADSLAMVPLLAIGSCGVLWAASAPERWTDFDRSMPISLAELGRVRLVAAWIATFLPVVPAWLVLVLAAPLDRAALAVDLGVGVMALLLFATIYATLLPGRRVAPWWLFALATASAILVVWAGLVLSAPAAGVCALGISVPLAAIHWHRGPVRIRADRVYARGRTTFPVPRRLVLLLAVEFLFLVVMSWQSRSFSPGSPWIWLPWSLLLLMEIITIQLRPLRENGALPLDRRRIALYAAGTPLALYVLALPFGLVAVEHGVEWSHLAPRVSTVENVASDGYRVEVLPPPGGYELVFGDSAPSVTRSDGTTFTPAVEPVGFGFGRVNPYEAGDGATYAQSLAMAERFVTDLYGADAPVERVRERMLERAYDGSASKRSKDPVTGRYDADEFDAIYSDHARRGSRAMFALVWSALVALWMLGAWAATTPRSFPRPRVHPMGVVVLGILGFGMLFVVVAMSCDELFAILAQRAGEAMLHPVAITAVVVLVAAWLHVIVRRVERMEARPRPVDQKSAKGGRGFL